MPPQTDLSYSSPASMGSMALLTAGESTLATLWSFWGLEQEKSMGTLFKKKSPNYLNLTNFPKTQGHVNTWWGPTLWCWKGAEAPGLSGVLVAMGSQANRRTTVTPWAGVFFLPQLPSPPSFLLQALVSDTKRGSAMSSGPYFALLLSEGLECYLQKVSGTFSALNKPSLFCAYFSDLLPEFLTTQ